MLIVLGVRGARAKIPGVSAAEIETARLLCIFVSHALLDSLISEVGPGASLNFPFGLRQR